MNACSQSMWRLSAVHYSFSPFLDRLQPADLNLQRFVVQLYNQLWLPLQPFLALPFFLAAQNRVNVPQPRLWRISDVALNVIGMTIAKAWRNVALMGAVESVLLRKRVLVSHKILGHCILKFIFLKICKSHKLTLVCISEYPIKMFNLNWHLNWWFQFSPRFRSSNLIMLSTLT